ncbi:MAG: hypothetical protein A2W31_16275 [Planctomycetes bacterium RBG_16_64_10]|nr:MAG: hypothetical protein A2W31_16275 [Planctomycetes bacterium RBG_16_64_10]
MGVFVEGAGAQIFAIRPPAEDRPQPDILWQRPGRGMGASAADGILTAVDLDGDHAVELVAAETTATGAAALVAYHADGQPFWRHAFEQTPGGHPVHNLAALTYWWPGHFRSTETIDLFVNTRRGLMHSDLGQLLDGRTGQCIWSRDKAVVPDQFHWGYAGMPISAADVLGDGRDELVNLYPVCFWIADGATGAIIAAQELASRKVLPAWAAYGEPLVHDFTGDGKPDILLDSVYILALLDAAGQPIWHGKARRDYLRGEADDNEGQTTSIRHALIDWDGDRRMELASGGYQDGVRAIDPRDGTVLWSLPAPQPTVGKCTAANIDGTGGDELLYAAGNTLVAITGDRQGGRVLWTWQGPAPLSLPAIADIDGDQRAEVLVQSAAGLVHCIDGPAAAQGANQGASQ